MFTTSMPKTIARDTARGDDDDSDKDDDEDDDDDGDDKEAQACLEETGPQYSLD